MALKPVDQRLWVILLHNRTLRSDTRRQCVDELKKLPIPKYRNFSLSLANAEDETVDECASTRHLILDGHNKKRTLQTIDVRKIGRTFPRLLKCDVEEHMANTQHARRRIFPPQISIENKSFVLLSNGIAL